MTNILITTTPTVENRPVREYLGIVSGEAFADTIYGRYWSAFKAGLHKARDWAIHQMAKAAEELGANAVIGVTISYVPEGDYWILIATGTAVRLWLGLMVVNSHLAVAACRYSPSPEGTGDFEMRVMP